MNIKKIDFSNLRNNIELLPIILLAVISPLIIYAKYLVLSSEYSKNYFSLGYFVDIYSYSKMVTITVAGIIMLLILIVNHVKVIRKISSSKVLWVLCILELLLLLSTVFSEYKGTALFGFVDRFEGFTAITTYIIAAIYCIVFITDEKKVTFVLKGILLSSLLISLYGILEFYGYVLLTKSWFVKMVLPKTLQQSIETINYSYTHRVSSTLYNPNFVGSYMTMTIMSTIGLCYSENKNILKYILIAIFSFALIGSESSAGFVAIIASFILCLFGIIILKRSRIIGFKNIVVSILIFILVTIFIPVSTGDRSFVAQEAKGFENKTYSKNLSEHKFGEILLEDGVMTIPFDNHEFNIKLDGENLSFFDENDEEIVYNLYQEDNRMVFEKKGFEDIEILFITDSNAAKLNFGALELILGFEKDGIKYADPMGNIYTSTNIIKKFGFEGNEGFASSRGYIWSRSLPILSSTIILGKGPDTYPFYFPQNDITGKINWIGGYGFFLDKPHNMYIQMGVNQGVLSVLLFVGLIVYLGINLLKEREKLTPIRVFTYVAVFGYCVAGVFNDSNVCVSPVFWTLLGITIAYKVNEIESVD